MGDGDALSIGGNHFIQVDARQVELPMYETVMEKLGRPIVFNICMLGAVIGLTKLVRPDSIMKALETQITHSFIEMNRQVLDLGLKLSEGIDAQIRPPRIVIRRIPVNEDRASRQTPRSSTERTESFRFCNQRLFHNLFQNAPR